MGVERGGSSGMGRRFITEKFAISKAETNHSNAPSATASKQSLCNASKL